MPTGVFHDLQQSLPDRLPRQSFLLRPLLSRLLLLDAASLSAVCGMGEGLEHRLMEKAQMARSFEGLVGAMATRRYPRSRIARLLVHVLTGFTAEAAAAFDATGPRYLRVLAMDARGAQLLHRAKKTARLPIITKTSQFLKSKDMLRTWEDLTPLQQMLLFDVRATELREMAVPERGRTGADFRTSAKFL
jgi:predicted nucleotidyltransferase